MTKAIETPDWDNITDKEFERVEAKMRRVAIRQGLGVSKSKSRTWQDPTFGKYHIYDRETNFILCGAICNSHDMCAEEVIDYLNNNAA